MSIRLDHILIVGALVATLAPRCPAPSLVELGAVNAIQGELASSAVPNYMRVLDQTKITTAEAEMRTLSQALEQYRADNGAYPVTAPMSHAFGPAPNDQRLARVWTFPTPPAGGPGNLTRPRAYLTSVPNDQFSRGAMGRDLPYAYFIDRRTNSWLIYSPGPDNDYDIDPMRDFASESNPPANALRDRLYDTNNPNDTDGDLYMTNRR